LQNLPNHVNGKVGSHSCNSSNFFNFLDVLQQPLQQQSHLPLLQNKLSELPSEFNSAIRTFFTANPLLQM